jgi:hypothetical protein
MADSSSSSQLPAKELLLTTGTGFLLGMLYFYRKKQTLPFKVSKLIQLRHVWLSWQLSNSEQSAMQCHVAPQ